MKKTCNFKVFGSRSMNLLLFSVLVLSLIACFPAETLLAQERGFGEGGRVYTIQKKAYRLKHELYGAVGVLPMDAFYKGVAVGGGYTYHFSHHYAWEVVQFLASFNMDTGLKKDLQNVFAIEPTAFRQVEFMASSNFVFVPLYGKMSLLNRKVIRMECFLTAGPGVSRYIYYERQGATGYKEEEKYYLSMNYGIGLRIFLNKRFSTRLDIRDYMNFVGDGIDHVAYFGLAVSWNFRLPKFSDMEEDG